MDALDFDLLNDYQHGFPLCSTPFLTIAGQLGVDENSVIDACARLKAEGRISRVGAVFAPRRVGASTLAAIRVPSARLAEVAAIVSRFAGVNHNYEREHEFNLWFVAAAASAEKLAATLAEIEAACRLPVLRLPLEAEYHIDLGFALDRLHGAVRSSVSPLARAPSVKSSVSPFEKGGTRGISAGVEPAPSAVVALDAGGQALVGALQAGLPLCPRPYAAIARRLMLPEAAVLARIGAWLASGVLKRFGVVVRHHELGYTANAMLVHDIPDRLVDTLGRQLGDESAVTLCYRRPRVPPQWSYNLFCMVHGRERAVVEQQIADLRRRHGLDAYPHAVLFSRTRYKQQGARYVQDHAEAVGA